MDELDYPDDDMDRMLDEELEIMRELEMERDKENSPHRTSKKNLEFATPGSTSLRAIDGNVGIESSKKRPRVDEVDDGIEAFNSIEEEEEMLRASEKTPISNKRFKKNLSPARETAAVLEEIDTNHFHDQVRIRVPRMGERKVYRRIPDQDFQAVTAPDGHILYLKMAKPASQDIGVCKEGSGDKRPVGLCGIPFHLLREAAETEIMRLTSAVEMQEEMDSGVESSEEGEGELWVEKFKPRTYTQLLSDDGTNRTLLYWLKLWDKVVFKKDKKPKPKPAEDEDGFKKFSNLPEVIEDFDELGRPQQRVSLLHGPPGLGKTTLAHIIARHAGYNVVEMNASDDRSIDAFKKKLENATQMRSVMAQDQRPNCLIIDEIDGAPAPTILHLVAVISGKISNKKKKGGAGSANILRPVICICNDLFTPALRPLRQMALVVPFPPTLSSRLASRLQVVCGHEKLKTDLTALLALCQKTDNDIRSCLSTLQFFRKRKGFLKAADVSKTSIGTKDAHRSLFSVWDDLFSIPRPGKIVASAEGGEGEPANSVSARYKSMLSTVYSCGEYERLLTGVFENYLNVKFKDSGMRNVLDGTEWFVHFDLLHKEMLHSQVYSIMGHLPFPLVASHLLFASNVKHITVFPTQHTENNAKLAKNENILASVVGEMAPMARVFGQSSNLVRDLLPLLLSVVQPSLRPVNTQLYSAREKKELASLVDVHIMYNITYQQERTLEGQYEYRMDPDIETVVCYPDIKRSIHLSYATKQLISHEIEVEKMKRADVVNVPVPLSEDSDKREEVAVQTPKGAKSTTSHLQKLKAKEIEESKKIATDFFGRVVKVDPNKPSKKVSNEIVKSDIWFKFKEGYSNAVRRTVKMKDLI